MACGAPIAVGQAADPVVRYRFGRAVIWGVSAQLARGVKVAKGNGPASGCEVGPLVPAVAGELVGITGETNARRHHRAIPARAGSLIR